MALPSRSHCTQAMVYGSRALPLNLFDAAPGHRFENLDRNRRRGTAAAPRGLRRLRAHANDHHIAKFVNPSWPCRRTRSV